MPNADDPRSGTPMNTDDELRHKVHMEMLSKSDSAKDLGELTVIPLGFAVSIALALIHKSNLQRAIDEHQLWRAAWLEHESEKQLKQWSNDRIKALQAELQQAEKEQV